jgi:hypothetical protein
MVEFFSTIPDKNLSRMCVLVQIGQNPPSLQCEYDQHISAFSPTTVKASNMFHTQEVAGSNPASRTIRIGSLRRNPQNLDIKGMPLVQVCGFGLASQRL